MHDIDLVGLSIMQTAGLIALSILAISLYRRLRMKTLSNKQFIARTMELQQANEESKRLEKSAMAELISHRLWHGMVLDGMDDLVLVHPVGKDGAPEPFIEVNDAACRILDYDRDVLLSKTIMDILEVEIPGMNTPFSDPMAVDERVKKFSEKKARAILEKVFEYDSTTFEDSFMASNGTSVPLYLKVLRCDLGKRRIALWVGRDISAVKEGIRAARESEKRLQDFFSYSPLGIAMYDGNRQLVSVNRSCLRMFGIPGHAEFERFNLFECQFLPADARKSLSRGASAHFEMTVNFDEVVRKAMFVSTRTGNAHYTMMITDLGSDENANMRGYFVQVEDITQKRKVEADLRKLQALSLGQSAPAGITGSLEDVLLTDIVQILCSGGKCMELELTNDSDKARLVIQAGSIIHCTDGKQEGEEAFYVVMKWQKGKFTARECKTPPPTRTITIPLMSLLMEGARRADEGTAPED